MTDNYQYHSQKTLDWDAVRQHLQASEALLKQSASRKPENWPELLTHRARQLQNREQLEHVKTKPFLAFETFGQDLLLDVNDLKAVKTYQSCTSLPSAPAELLGVVQHRGQILSVLELGRLLGLPGSVSSGGYILFIRSQPVIGLRIASLTEIVQLEAQAFQTRQDNPDNTANYLSQVTLNGQLKLDIDRLLTHPLLHSTARI